MNAHKSLIDESRSMIQKNDLQLDQIYQSVGEKAFTLNIKAGNDDEISRYLLEISKFNSEIKDKEKQIKDIQTSTNRISEISNQEKTFKEEFTEIEKENKKLLQIVGRSAYLEWKANPVESLNEIMKDIEIMENKITELESNISLIKNNTVKTSFINKIQSKSKLALYNSQKLTHQTMLIGTYKHTGEKVFEISPSFLENISDENVAEFLANAKTLKQLDNDLTALKGENSQIEAHIKTEFAEDAHLNDEDSHSEKTVKAVLNTKYLKDEGTQLAKNLKNKFGSGKQIKEGSIQLAKNLKNRVSGGKNLIIEEKLKSERDVFLSAKENKLGELGFLLYEKKMSLENETINSTFNDIDHLQNENTNLTKEIEKHEAELKILELAEIISKKEKKVGDLASSIKSMEAGITVLNNEIKEINSDIKKLKKVTES